MSVEDEVRQLAHSLPPSDFCPTRAIQAVAEFVRAKLSAAEAERDTCLTDTHDRIAELLDRLATAEKLSSSYEAEAQKHSEDAARFARWHRESQSQLQDCSAALDRARKDFTAAEARAEKAEKRLAELIHAQTTAAIALLKADGIEATRMAIFIEGIDRSFSSMAEAVEASQRLFAR